MHHQAKTFKEKIKQVYGADEKKSIEAKPKKIKQTAVKDLKLKSRIIWILIFK